MSKVKKGIYMEFNAGAALKLYILSLSSVTNVLSPSCNREIQKSISLKCCEPTKVSRPLTILASALFVSSTSSPISLLSSVFCQDSTDCGVY